MPPPSPSTLSAVFASQASSPSPFSSSPQTSKAALLVAQGRAKYAAGDRMGALALFESALKQVRPRHRKSVVFVISHLAPPVKNSRPPSPNSLSLPSSITNDNPQSPSAPEAAAASWNATVVHCSFGDVELAQVTLREALAAGLDFDAALRAEGRRVTAARVDEVAAAVAENESSPGSVVDRASDPAAAAAAALRLPFAGSPQVASQLRKFARAFARASSSSSGSSGRSAAPPSYSSSSSSSPSSPISVDGIDASPAAIAKRVVVLLAALIGLGVGLFLYGLQYL